MIYRHQRKLTRFIRAIYKGFRDKTGILETICQFRCKGTTPSDDDDSSKKNYNYITKQHLYPTYMQYIANLDVNSPVLNYTKKAGIICTVGPSSKSVEILEQMMDAGMDIARLNFSHGTHEYHKESIANIREAVKRRSKRYGIPLPIGIALDTKGPEVRTGQFPKGEKDEVLIKKGDTLTLHTDQSYYHKGSTSDIFIDLPSMPSSVRPGTSIFIDDGLIHLKVVDTGTTTITCLIENGGLLGSRKGVNVPGVKLNLPSISDQDKDDICFGVEQGIDIIFASFIRRREDIFHIRRLLSACASKGEKGNDIQIIAKIENHEGVDNFDEIMESSDGIMVARGDLGIEINSERVFLAQKRMIASCNLAGKPVICATQMLESMTKKPRPTRAESSDVANAILDGADCVMLSGETAKGDYPVECVHVMADICKVSEEAVQHMKVFQEVIRVTPSPTNKTNAVAIAAVAAANKTLAEGILVITSTGYSAHVVSKFRPPCNIYAITTSESVARKCYLHRGVIPVLHTHEVPDEWSVDTELRILSGLKKGLMMKYIHKGDMVVVLTGWKKGRGNTSTMRILYVDDTIYKTVLAHVN